MLKLANGEVIDTKTKKVVRDKEEKEESEHTQALPSPIPKDTLRLEDMPASPSMMNAICAVIGYKMIGLRDADICISLNCTQFQLDGILNNEAYTTAYDKVRESFMHGQDTGAREIIASGAVSAAQEIVKIATRSRSEGNRLKAADSILNRMNIGGESGGGMGDTLNIRIMKDTSGGDTLDIRVNKNG